MIEREVPKDTGKDVGRAAPTESKRADTVEEALEHLRRQGYFVHSNAPAPSPRLLLAVGSFVWSDEYYDQFHVDGDDAVAVRVKPEALPGRDEVVWTYEGTTLVVLNALLALPTPGHSDAPRRTRVPGLVRAVIQHTSFHSDASSLDVGPE